MSTPKTSEPARPGRARAVNSPDLAPAIGFAHAIVAGHTVYLGGQTARAKDGRIQGTTIVEQFDCAAANLLTALTAAGGEPDDLVTLQVFVTDVEEYRGSLVELARAWCRYFGKYYPSMGVFRATRLSDEAAKVELMGTAWLPQA